MSTSKQVDKKGSTGVGQVLDYGEMSGAGLDDVGADEIVIPFINVLQALSPEVDERDDCKAGMLFNKGTQEPIDGQVGFPFLPVARQEAYVEWVPRKQGGGLAGRHEPSSDVVRRARQEAIDRGEDPRFGVLWTGEPEKSNELRHTYYLYGFILEETQEGVYDIVGQALLSFTGTKIKVYKNWMTPIKLLKKPQPPLFAHVTRVTTFKDGNAKGEFYNFRLTPEKNRVLDSLLDPKKNADLLKAAQEFAAGVKSDAYKMGDEGDAPAEEEVPF